MAEAQELRVQPHDLVAEQSVLGAIFINPEKLITVREFIEADDFYKYSHRVIFKAMVTLSDRNDAIDATTVRTILDDQDDLQNIGGISYLVDLVNSVPTSANAEYYAKIVAEKAMLRRIINRLTEIVNQAYEGTTESDEIIANAEPYSVKDLKINGFDLINLGFKGKVIGNILSAVLEMVIDGKLENEKDILLKYAKEKGELN